MLAITTYARSTSMIINSLISLFSQYTLNQQIVALLCFLYIK